MLILENPLLHLKRLRRLLPVAFICIAGCALLGPPTARIDVPAMTPVAAADLSAFDRAAIGAVQMRLRGAAPEEIARELLVAGSEKIAPESNFRYDGFVLRQVDLVRQTQMPDGSRAIYALLGFVDLAGRRAGIDALLRYRQTPTGIELLDAAWHSLSPATPRSTMYVLPAKLLDDAWPEAAKDYWSLYKFARLHAVPMSDAANAIAEPADYAILVFVPDRVAADAGFELRLSDRRNSAAGYAQDSQTVFYDGGWPVGIVVGNFALTETAAFWVKAVYTPGSDQESAPRAEQVVGLFSTAPGR